jgi:putative addiction module CopG family antidote
MFLSGPSEQRAGGDLVELHPRPLKHCLGAQRESGLCLTGLPQVRRVRLIAPSPRFRVKIELTARHKQYVAKKVKSGAYGSADEVLREGLRLLEAEDARVRRVAWLRSEVEKGFTSPFTPWTAKDLDRVRQLVARQARRKR